MPDARDGPISAEAADSRQRSALPSAGALQTANVTSANLLIGATDEKGVIEHGNVGPERMLGYKAVEVVNCITSSDIHDPQEVKARAEALSIGLGTPIAQGFEAHAFNVSGGIEAMKILHAHPVTGHILIIAQSASAVPRDIQPGLEAGFISYITEPIKVLQSMAALDAALPVSKAAKWELT